MSIMQAVLNDWPLLTHTAHHAIVAAMNLAWQQKASGKQRPIEAEMVACLSLHAAPIFAADWQQILAKYGVHLSSASVFCHGTPIVKFGGPKGSELGDILFVHKHQDQGGAVRRNALLFQAKVAPAQPRSIGKKDLHQLRLYQNWPDFCYVNPPSLRDQSRKVQPKTWHLGAQYLQLDGRPPSDPKSGLQGGPYFPHFSYFPAGACLPQNPLRIHHDLATELVSWLSGLSGRPFGDKTSTAGTNGWSRVVWDLLESSLNKALGWKRSQYRGKPRYTGDNLNLLNGASLVQRPENFSILVEAIGDNAKELCEPPNDNTPLDLVPPDDDGGISIVVLDTLDEGEG